jgi:nuclear protein NHN1
MFERGPPPPRGVVGGPPRAGFDYSPPSKYPRTGPGYFEEQDQYGRMSRPYRELPAHRMPHYEDEDIGKRRTVRATREVIVEKASDEWSDPWMRKTQGRGGEKERKGRGGGGRERSYSSNSSYSSSSSSSRSRSHSSSDSSRSPSRHRRIDSKHSKERATSKKVERPKSRSASRRHSLSKRIVKKAVSPATIPKRKRPISPPSVRPEKSVHSRKKRDSSSSSGSESDSSYSSSTSSSKGKKKREKLVSERKPVAVAKKGTSNCAKFNFPH